MYNKGSKGMSEFYDLPQNMTIEQFAQQKMSFVKENVKMASSTLHEGEDTTSSYIQIVLHEVEKIAFLIVS